MKTLLRSPANAAGVFLMAVLPLAGAAAQDYPSKPLTLVVGYPPGGGPDVEARMLAEQLAGRFGQPVVVENRPGASGLIGAGSVARAPADGYTLLFTPSTFLIAPQVLKSVKLDVLDALVPVVMTSQSTMVMVAHPSLGVRDAKALAAYARRHPGLAYASPGSGSPMHIAGEMFKKAAGVDMLHVPYKGVAPALTDVLGGQVKVTYSGLAAVGAQIASGKLVALATVEKARSPLLPGLPTLIEQGFPGVSVGAWYGVYAPKGTPAAVVDRLNREFNAVIAQPAVAEKLRSLWELPRGGTPAELAQVGRDDYAAYGKIIAELQITAD